MKKIPLDDASAAEIRQFASTVLGLELTGKEQRAALVGKLAEVGYNADFITVVEVAAAPTLPKGDGQPFNVRLHKDGKRNEVRIIIPFQDIPGGRRPVPVTVNGKCMWIPRGEPHWVLEEYVEVLKHAEAYVYPEYDPETNLLGGLQEPERVLSYPFSYA